MRDLSVKYYMSKENNSSSINLVFKSIILNEINKIAVEFYTFLKF